MTKHVGIVLITALTLGGCASMHGGTRAAAGSAATQAIAKAQAALQHAGTDAALWSVTVQDLAKAKKAEAAGKQKQAIAWAHEVLKQTALSEAQAKTGAQARPVYPGV